MTENEEPFELDEVSEGSRACPVCSKIMTLERKDAVSIEVCAEHGIWLDKGELGMLVKAVERREKHKSRRSSARALREGKKQGAFWGWWSLLD